MVEVKFQLEASKHVTTELETKDGVAEAKLYQHYKDTNELREALEKLDDERKTLKIVIKNKKSDQIQDLEKIKNRQLETYKLV